MSNVYDIKIEQGSGTNFKEGIMVFTSSDGNSNITMSTSNILEGTDSLFFTNERVANSPSISNLGAYNGLNKNGSTFGLGGTLFENTSIEGNSKNLFLGTTSSVLGKGHINTDDSFQVVNTGKGASGFGGYIDLINTAPTGQLAFMDFMNFNNSTTGDYAITNISAGANSGTAFFGTPYTLSAGRVFINAYTGNDDYYQLRTDGFSNQIRMTRRLTSDSNKIQGIIGYGGGGTEGFFVWDTIDGIGLNYWDRAVDESNITWATDLNHIPSMGLIIDNVVLDSDFTSNGFMTRTSKGTYTSREIIGTANEIAVNNTSGVGGNPTISLPPVVDIGDKKLIISNSDDISLINNGDIGIDNNGTNLSHGLLKYYSGEELGVVSMHIDEFQTLDTKDGYSVVYSALNQTFEMVDLTSSTSGEGPLTDGDKGDIVVTSDTTIWTIDNGVVSNAKLANMTQDTIKGRITTGTGDPEDLTATQVRTILNVEDGADVTDTANVDSAGATMNTDTDVSANGWVIDEDNLISNDDTKVPTQQSVKAYVDTTVTSAKSYQGGYDANTNTPDLDTTPIAGISSGDVYDVTVAGTFFTIAVEVGDTLTARQDNPTLESHWVVTQTNLTPTSIKTQYESNADTNAFTDAEKTKLSGLGDYTTAGLATIAYVDSVTGNEPSNGDKGDITVTNNGTTWTADNLAITNAKIAENTIQGSKIQNNAVTYAKLQNVTSNNVFLGNDNGAGQDVQELTASEARTILNVSDGANNYSHPNHTGDVTSVGDGATTITNNAVTNAKLRDSSALSIIGRSANTTGDPADISASVDGQVLRRSGTTLAFGTIATTGITNDAVTNAKLSDMAQSTIKGRASGAGTGDPTDLTATQVRTIINVEDGADVTDETNVTSSLSGATLTSVTVTSSDKILIQDSSDSDNLKTVTAQSIADLGGGGGATNLSVANRNASTLDVASDTGTDATIPAVTTSLSGLMTGSDKTKLNGVATNANNYSHPNHTGDVTSTGDGATVITNDAVTNAKLANMTQATIKGRASGAGTGDPTDLTATQATAILNTFTTSLKGLAPASGGGTTNFLRADGTWAEPSGGGGGATILSADETIIQGSWSGNTDYEYSVTVTGAVVGDFCLVQADEDVMDNINTADTVWEGYAYCDSANTVTVVCRITSFINIPASSIFTVKVIQ